MVTHCKMKGKLVEADFLCDGLGNDIMKKIQIDDRYTI